MQVYGSWRCAHAYAVAEQAPVLNLALGKVTVAYCNAIDIPLVQDFNEAMDFLFVQDEDFVDITMVICILWDPQFVINCSSVERTGILNQ